MKKRIFGVLIALTFLFQLHVSKADVLIESGAIDGFAAAGVPGVNQLTFGSGSGQAGDFFLFTCVASSSFGMNSFNDPDPAIFTQRSIGECGSSSCVEGIWTGFTGSAGSVDVSCNTAGASILIAAGLLRYSNVDPLDPVIAITCDQGTSNSATAPSIDTEAGSQVVRIFNSSTINAENTNNNINTTPQAASFSSEATVDGGLASTIGESSLFNSNGPTGIAIQPYTGEPRSWTACTMALRMLPAPPTDPPPTNPPPTMIPPPTPPPTRNIPALSVWGNITLAVVALVFGAWYLRRKKVKP